jgi:hypothetical protein
LGWRNSAGYYSSFELNLPALEDIVQCKVVEQWECEIQDVKGLSSSKSVLKEFASLDALVETKSRELISEITEEKLRSNLAHNEIRIFHEQTSDHFARYGWDGRTFLINSGGSHHFAAARYIASRICHPVPLRGKLRTYKINKLAIEELRRDFDVYAISDDADISNEFFNAMKRFQATYLSVKLPSPFENSCAIFLPKKEPRSKRVSRALREAGMFDICEYLHGEAR